MEAKKVEVQQILESLSPVEKKILPYLKEDFENLEKIKEKSGLDETSILRALDFLQNKKILITKETKKQIIELDVNGILYQRKGLPERRLLHLIAEKKNILLNDAQKQSKLNDNEFKAALGALKSKALVNLANEKIILRAKTEEISKKSLEEQFLDALPLELEKLKSEEKFAYENLRKRKQIVMLRTERVISLELTNLGEKIISQADKLDKDLIEKLDTKIIKTQSWKGKKFRRYDIKSKVPEIFGGKKHFVNQAAEYARKLWLEMGFEEMTGNLVIEGFWNFDALFTAQDHPVRELQDTFYIKDKKGTLPDEKLVQAVKLAHESGVDGSKGWQYCWDKEEAKKLLLRTHTTCLSAQTLAKLRELKDKRGKFFAIGKCFRNETLDWSHGFEFNQTEGIVVDKNANFCHLFGYLKEFFRKMGFEKIRFRPSYFPYTEPSVEIEVFHPEKKLWLELGGAGIFRPEVTIPLLGEYIPVLAWGPGFDRIIMDYYEIKDLREFYKNDLTQLRNIKIWKK